MASLWVALVLLAMAVRVPSVKGSLIRKNVNSLSEEEVASLQSYLRQLEDDLSENGYQAMAAYHGEPSSCSYKGKSIACCIHGMATFPQWHRAYVVQFEQELVGHGLANIGVPYWDWTQPITSLPEIVQHQVFRDPMSGIGKKNAWFSGDIHIGDLNTFTARAIDDRLYEKVAPGGHTKLYDAVLDALEQTDYCQFEAQFEIAHNTIHFLVGGRHQYGMSTLGYSSYDPIFFLHHSNVDRLFAIWLKLQERRGIQTDHSDCNVELFNRPLHPFDRDTNPIQLTKGLKPKDLFGYLQLGYQFDDLSLNGMDIDALHDYLEQRRARERAFAVFSLTGIGISADVRVKVCNVRGEETTNCASAGDFFILGGPNEMPWEFDVPYYFDISKAVQEIGQPLDGNFRVVHEIFSVNGTQLDASVINKPRGSHRPSKGHKDPPIEFHHVPKNVVRKDIETLTDEEVDALRQAMRRFQNDLSIDGFQAVAEFHGSPAKCPNPDAAIRFACCIHGMATFPHWHRLFVVEVEDELRSRGLEFGIPYWDWTKPNAHIPALAAEATYVDPTSQETLANPFYDAEIVFKGNGMRTVRDVQDDLSETPKFGDHTTLFDGILLALEQTDFCDFEVQLEVVHNNPHFMVGGYHLNSMTSLELSAFDPIFYLHHSNVDRIWAIWQQLQIRRGLNYKAHCANSLTNEILKPFGFPPPWNNDQKTFDNAAPTNIYDFEEVLDYTYDNLQFGGMDLDQLEHYLEERQAHDRTFVGIMLHGIGVSAYATVTVTAEGHDPYTVGHIAVLGGENEMPWRFDRAYRMEITDALAAMGLAYDDTYEIHLAITDINKGTIEEDVFHHENIIHVPAASHQEEDYARSERVRSDVSHLTVEQEENLRDAFKALEEDTSVSGYEQIAAFHGQPKWCPSPDAEQKFACCAHGMPVFPHWHRLLTVQAENALAQKGLSGGLPYWDWTLPMTELPHIVAEATYTSPRTGETVDNPLHHALVENHQTTRSLRQELFEQPEFGHFTTLAEKVILAFEQTDFCDFEIQFEIAHNYIHAVVGGNDPYSMASLRYSAYDPIFYLHHSNTDRIWAIWQALQKYRGLPYNIANCAIDSFRKPLQPFAQTSVINPDPVTRDNSIPFKAFDYEGAFHYHYDSLLFNGLSVAQLQREIVRREAEERVFVGFMLHGIKQSALVVFNIVKPGGESHKAGEFYLLGDEYELPWEYDRLFKYEITADLKAFDLAPRDKYDIEYHVYALDGTELADSSSLFGTPVIIDSLGSGHLNKEEYRSEVLASSHVRQNLEDLSDGEKESLRNALQKMEEDGSFEKIAAFHGWPGLCTDGDRKVACCVHGSPTFPAWHRLYVEQVENALLSHGSAVSVPYWDWTKNIDKLPELFNAATFFNSRTHEKQSNSFFRLKITGEDGQKGHYTTRDPQPDLFNNGEYFLNQVLMAMEQTSFCDFEVQFEIAHNAIHSLLGGRGKYSLSSLDYSAYDPVFFLHHANVDRIWAIWQALQRFRGLPFDESDCALNLMGVPLHPFDDEAQNQFSVTVEYSRARDVFDYSGHLNYHYDNLKLNDWTIPQLEEVITQRKSTDRLFAGFLLHNIGMSAEVEIYVCVKVGGGAKNCDHPAGKFSLLGGDYEMPFTFDRLYKHDISDTIRELGLPLDTTADFDVAIKIKSYNGSYINTDILHQPSIIFQPGKGTKQDSQGKTHRRLVRKNVNSLSPTERRSLVMAAMSLDADSSADGFQSLAAFHAVPPLCPSPEASERFACCVHGAAVFPLWHRLYTVQFEQAMYRHGAIVGIPYWDTIVTNEGLPGIVGLEKFFDPILQAEIKNPYYAPKIEFDNHVVARDVNFEKLAKKGPHGYDTYSWKQYLYALEQENFCDFEVQFEIAHNAIHNWIGGKEVYSMSHLHYASYDPIFYLHHANTDRIFALWQELQRNRGHDPNDVNCALELMQEPLKPFSFGPPYNLNSNTQFYANPEDGFDYENHFNYQYDKLELQGVDATRLQDYIDKEKEHDRVFVGFLLSGIGTSAHVHFDVCPEGGDCIDSGYFDILGGSAEMPWHFDRLYKYEITDILEANHIDVHDAFDIQLRIKATHNETALSSDLIPKPTVIYQPGSRKTTIHEVAPNRVRREINRLTRRDKQSMKAALRDLQRDTSLDGYQNIARFHGSPPMCPSPDNPTESCCIHGMPTFPHWHRLYVVELEDAMVRHGASVAVPYWDWTMPIKELPDLFTTETYYDAWRDEVVANPFARSNIDSVNGYTVRNPQPELYKLSRDGKHSVLFDEVLLALEQTDFCDFEVQYEVVHNAIHYLVGGREPYSLASLEYSSYDPIFFVHHAFVDKIWAVWQELQKRRGLPANRADCAVNFMNEKMHPFDWESLNQDVRTREHAMPNTVFDYQDLGYHYDDLMIGNNTLEELEERIRQQQSHPRVFAGFHLKGIQTSADVIFSICTSSTSCVRAGGLFILGGPLEHPWEFDRLFKYDITDALKDLGIEPEDVFSTEAPFELKYEVTSVSGQPLPLSKVPAPSIIFQPAAGADKDASSYTLAGIGVRKNINKLTNAETAQLRQALRKLQSNDGVFVTYNDIAKAHGYPAQCEYEGHEVACCHHGMASFPQWHRLFTRQMEVALYTSGARVGIPYWDWTEAFTALPALVSEEEDGDLHNPFHHGVIPGKNEKTTRSPRPNLFRDPEHGDESFFYRQAVLAFEQRDYCDFEVQFEVLHNAIHSWIGGTSPYGMSTLEYSAYDPIFFIHHSNVDRQFAIWQALQKYRGLDYNTANCNIQELRQNLEPYNRDDNPFVLTRTHSRAIDAFNVNELGYQYDDLNFHGMSIPELDRYLQKDEEHDHVYAEFMLKGIGTSADVVFDLCDEEGHCNFAGTFAILGGPLEMPWMFDRTFKYDVTNVFRQMRLRPDSDYHFDMHVTAVNGTELDSTLIETPSVTFVPGRKSGSQDLAHRDPPPLDTGDLVRYDVSSLSLEQVSNLRNALHKLQNDHGPNGFESIAGFHGYPGLCPENASDHYACCRHGMPAFPAWHRLLTVQFERALKEKGAVVGIPYWDWTSPAKALPSLFTQTHDNNPYHTYRITSVNRDVEREVNDLLYTHPDENDVESLFHQALETLEETNFCDFEVQYEMLHNIIHEMVGGTKKFGMSTLEYSAYDPFFMVHHSSIDRIWIIWQQLQKLRHKPFNYAMCAHRALFKPMEPFSYESVNADPLTRQYSKPIQVADKSKFHYSYDKLTLHGHDVAELHEMIQNMQSQNRIFAGFVLSGIKTSASVEVFIVAEDGHKEHVGFFYVLGGPTEMPWAYERIYKMDITDAAKKLGLGANSRFSWDFKVTKYDGTVMDIDFPRPVIIKRMANDDHDILVLPLKLKNTLPPKIVVRRGTRVIFHATEDGFEGPVREVGSYTSAVQCAIPPGSANAYELDHTYDLEPGDYFFTNNDKDMCLDNHKIQITVDDE